MDIDCNNIPADLPVLAWTKTNADFSKKSCVNITFYIAQDENKDDQNQKTSATNILG